MFELFTMVHVPIFFGLFYRSRPALLGTFDCYNDAVGYAFNECGFDSCDDFFVYQTQRMEDIS
jgi:hypothetical protein